MDTDSIRDIGILVTMIGGIYMGLSAAFGENILNGTLVLIVGGMLILMSLLLSEQKSTKTTKIRRKTREIKKPALYRISPKTEQRMPGEKINYTTSITNLLPEKITGNVKITAPESWRVDKNNIEFGPIKKENTEDVTFEVEIPQDAKLGFVYKITIEVAFLDHAQELSAVVELLSKEDELLTIEEDEQIMKALEGL